MIDMNIDNNLILEAFQALVEKKNTLIEELYEKESQEFKLAMILLDLINKRCPGDKKWFAEEIKANNFRTGGLSDKKLTSILDYLRDEDWFD